jgi:hypothetical protein
MVGDNNLMARKIRVDTSIRCDWDHRVIEKGKYATQVVGDPDHVKAQGIYHGRLCYESALTNYEEKVKELDMKETHDE